MKGGGGGVNLKKKINKYLTCYFSRLWLNFEKQKKFSQWQQPLSESAINQGVDNYHLSGNFEHDILRKRPITLSICTTDGVSFQNKKGTDFANSIEGDI